MRGPKPSYPIGLTEAEVKSLQQQARAHTTGQSLAVRARIVLSANAHPGWSNQQIAQEVGTTDRNVRKWRGRWVATHSIADAPRSGAPRHFSPAVRTQVTATACSLPRQSGVPLARLSSSSHSTTGGSYDEWASPFQQNGRTLVESRAVATMALS